MPATVIAIRRRPAAAKAAASPPCASSDPEALGRKLRAELERWQSQRRSAAGGR